MKYKHVIAFLGGVSGLVLAVGVTPYNIKKINKRLIAVIGTFLGTMLGTVYSIRGKPLLMR